MRRLVFLLMLSVMVSSMLSACGKKGPLELPDGRTADPGQDKKDEDPSGFKN